MIKKLLVLLSAVVLAGCSTVTVDSQDSTVGQVETQTSKPYQSELIKAQTKDDVRKIVNSLPEMDCSSNRDFCHYIASMEYITMFQACSKMEFGDDKWSQKDTDLVNEFIIANAKHIEPKVREDILRPDNQMTIVLHEATMKFLHVRHMDFPIYCSGAYRDEKSHPELNSNILRKTKNYEEFRKSISSK